MQPAAILLLCVGAAVPTPIRPPLSTIRAPGWEPSGASRENADRACVARGVAVSGVRVSSVTNPVATEQSRPVSARTSISRNRGAVVEKFCPKSMLAVNNPSTTRMLSAHTVVSICVPPTGASKSLNRKS